jgi:hypothetical protein
VYLIGTCALIIPTCCFRFGVRVLVGRVVWCGPHGRTTRSERRLSVVIDGGDASSTPFYLCFLVIYTLPGSGDCFNTHVGGSISEESDSVFTSTLSNKINLKLGGMTWQQACDSIMIFPNTTFHLWDSSKRANGPGAGLLLYFGKIDPSLATATSI